MKRLILTTDDTGAGNLKQTGLADIVIPFGVRFVWGPLLSDQELDELLGLVLRRMITGSGMFIGSILEKSVRAKSESSTSAIAATRSSYGSIPIQTRSSPWF